MTTPWNDTDSGSWRWVRWFAWHPVNTFDAGWIWLRFYWRYQAIWGWGFLDDHPYLEKDARQ